MTYVYSEQNYVDSDKPLKAKKYYEFISTDTSSIEIEHQLRDEQDPRSITYSKFTIKKILTPLVWRVDHLLRLQKIIALTIQKELKSYF